MQKITESELLARVRGLREYMAEAEPAHPGNPTDWANGINPPVDWVKDPATGKYSAPAAPAAAAPAAAAPAGPANAKEQNYQIALKQIKDLYAKSQVPYPPTDKIVQSRYGLPDALPPIDQWDGTMPKSTGADFLTRNLLGRQASKDTAAAQAVNDKSNAGNARADAAVAADMTKLTALVGQLKALSATPAPAPAQGAKPAAAPAVPGVKAGGGVVDTRGGIGGVDEMEESTSYFLNKLRLLEAAAPTATAGTPPPPAVGTPAAAPAAGGDKASIIKQIQDIMANINAQNENPPQDVIKALGDAQAAIDAANKPTGSAALDGTKPGADPATTIPGGPATAAGGAGVVPPSGGQGAKPAGDPKVMAFQQELIKKGAKIKADGVYGPGTNQAAMQFGMAPPAGIKTTANAGGATAKAPAQGAKTPPAAPAQKGSMLNPMNWFKEGEMTEQELVKFKDDETLARIIDITRR